MCHHDANKLKAITKMSGISKGDVVLDVGTGTGVMLPFIHELIGDEGEITAVDLAEKMLDIARKKHSFNNVNYLLGDISSVNLPKNNFDVIMCYSVFPHFQDKPGIISHMSGLLKPNGKLVIAHSQSREAINNLHSKSSDAVSQDDLPEAAIIEGYMKKAGLIPTLTKDNDEMFVVIGQKSNQKLWQNVNFMDMSASLAIGFKACEAAIKNLVLVFKDEEVVCVTENDACGVDAIQVITGCTLGKGNLIYRDWEKCLQFLPSYRQNSRIVLKPTEDTENMSRAERQNAILESPVEELFSLKFPNIICRKKLAYLIQLNAIYVVKELQNIKSG